MDGLPPGLQDSYARDFRLADEAFRAGRMAATSIARETRWKNWTTYLAPMGFDPYLQSTTFEQRIRGLTGFAQRVRTGYYGRGRQVQAPTVTGAITAVGQTISLAIGHNPTKVLGSDKFLPALQVMIDGFAKEDPPTRKMLPVEADVPECLVEMGYSKSGTAHTRAVGDLSLIAFYYLLRIGEYTVKSKRNNVKQTVQFKLEDVTFYKKTKSGQLRCLPKNAPAELILSADSATLKLDNQKNGWKGVCVHQETNGDRFYCPIRALGRRVVHLRQHKATKSSFLSTYYHNGKKCDVIGEDISKGLKMAATLLEYPETRGIPIELVDTHSLRCGGANALALSGFSDTQIQKMGRWRGATFKEYIREQLACYSEGMSKAMKRNFKFVNVHGNSYHDVTSTCVLSEYASAA